MEIRGEKRCFAINNSLQRVIMTPRQMPEMLYQLSVPVSPDAEESVVELLEGMFGTGTSVETDLERGTTSVSVFLKRLPDRRKLKEVLPRFSVRKLPKENWAESWKRHFKPMQFGSRLLVKPGWSRRRAKPGQALVVLDPGLSFGTGQHPTTRFCLEQIVGFRKERQQQSFLDVGTGSGILAIAAAKLGYAPVEAFDFDPVAVRIARANAKKNRVHARINLSQADVSERQVRKKFDLICANLISDLLIEQRDRLAGSVAAGGRLVLAGILKLQFCDVRAAYENAGLKLIATGIEQEWQSGAFENPRQIFPRKLQLP